MLVTSEYSAARCKAKHITLCSKETWPVPSHMNPIASMQLKTLPSVLGHIPLAGFLGLREGEHRVLFCSVLDS